MLKKFLLFLLCSIVALSVQAQTPPTDKRAADRAEIRAHIESICQAFIDWDVDKIYATHTQDWRGFLENTRVPIRGIDEYMRANGITWPRPNDAPKPAPTATPDPTAATFGFKVFDFDVNFYGPELAVACFMLDFGKKSGDTLVTGNRLRIMDVYAKRNGHWIQAASHTVVDPAWRAQQMSMPATVAPQLRQQILTAREAVWRAYFTNDQAQLDKLVPADTIVLEGSPEKPFVKKADILESAKQSAQSGNKLVRLEFPQTEMQVYGDTAIIYTSYLYELENAKGERYTSTGRATEVFVRRQGAWVNPGWHLTPAKWLVRQPGVAPITKESFRNGGEVMTDNIVDRPRWNIAPYFIVDDVVTTANYYRDQLGFQYSRFWGEPPSFCMVTRNGIVIMLGQLEKTGLMRPNRTVDPEGGAWDAYIWINDADALNAEFKSKGVQIVRDVCDQPYGCRDFEVDDCNGYRLCFGQDLEG